jgi:hypothetical protein
MVHLSSFTARVTTEIVLKTTNEASRLETGTVSINDANADLDLIKAAAPTANSEPLEHLPFFTLTNRYSVLKLDDPGDFVNIRSATKHAPCPFRPQARNKEKSTLHETRQGQVDPPIRTSSPDPPTDPSGAGVCLTALTMAALATLMLVTIIAVRLQPGLAVAIVTETFQAMLLSMKAASISLNAVYMSCKAFGNRQSSPTAPHICHAERALVLTCVGACTHVRVCCVCARARACVCFCVCVCARTRVCVCLRACLHS